MPIIVIVCKYLKMFMVEMNFTHPELELLSTKTGSEPRIPSCWHWGKEEGELSTSGVQPCADKGNMGLVVGDHCVLGLSELCLTWFHRNTENPETAPCILATGWILSLYHRLFTHRRAPCSLTLFQTKTGTQGTVTDVFCILAYTGHFLYSFSRACKRIS